MSSARAKRSRWRSPPEHFLTLRVAIRVAPARSSASVTGMWRGWQAATMDTVSFTVRSASSPSVCSTAPTRPARTARWGEVPSTDRVPDVGSVNPSTMSRNVVLPAPLGPSRATISPRSTDRSTPSTARTEPKCRWTPVACRAVPLGDVPASWGAVGAVWVVSALVIMAPACSVWGWSGSVRCHDLGMTDVMGGCPGGPVRALRPPTIPVAHLVDLPDPVALFVQIGVPVARLVAPGQRTGRTVQPSYGSRQALHQRSAGSITGTPGSTVEPWN